MLVVWATRRYVPGAAGSGIPQVVAATRLSAAQTIDGRIALQWHAPLTRFFATVATYFSGIPAGAACRSPTACAAVSPWLHCPEHR